MDFLLLWFPLGMSLAVLLVCVVLLVFVRRRTLRKAGRETTVQMPELWALGKFLVLTVGGVGFLLCFIWLGAGEGLFVAEPVVYVVRVAFVAGFAWLASRLVGSLGRDLQAAGLMEKKGSDPLAVKMMIAMVIVLAIYSHGMVWGGFQKMGLGRPVELGAAVVGTGHRAKYGSWVNVRIEGRTRAVQMMPKAIYPVQGEDYSCGIYRVQVGDTLRLVGRVSFWGLAVEEIRPGNERLVKACRK